MMMPQLFPVPSQLRTWASTVINHKVQVLCTSYPSTIGKYVGTPLASRAGRIKQCWSIYYVALHPVPLYRSSTRPSVIQLARYSAFYPIIVTTSLKYAYYLKIIGTTYIIDRKAHLAEEIKKITDKPITVVLDAISDADTQQVGVVILVVGGMLIMGFPATVKAEVKEIISIVG